MAVPLSILDATLRDEALLELGQAFVNVADTISCADDLLVTAVTVTESQLTSGVAVRSVVFASPPLLLLDPSREATDPRFEFHVPIASNQVGGNEGGDVMFVSTPMPVSVFRMTPLPEPVADLAISLMELVTDGATMVEFPQGLPQLPVSVNFLLVEH